MTQWLDTGFSKHLWHFNYGDDNTVSCYDMSTQEVLNKLNDVLSKMLTWLSLNEMKVNSDTFQLIVFNRLG